MVDNKTPELDYFMNESVSDVVFVVNGHKVPAIKEVLGLNSHVFRAMFADPLTPNQIEIHGTTVEAFKVLIFFIYFNRLEIGVKKNKWNLIENLFSLARYYQLLSLEVKIEEYMRNNTTIKIKNLKAISRIAFTYDCKQVIGDLKSFMKEKANLMKILDKSEDEISELNDATNNALFETVVRAYRLIPQSYYTFVTLD